MINIGVKRGICWIFMSNARFGMEVVGGVFSTGNMKVQNSFESFGYFWLKTYALVVGMISL